MAKAKETAIETPTSTHVLELLKQSGETLGPAEIARRLDAKKKMGSGNSNTQRGKAVSACAQLVKKGLVVAVPREGGGHQYRAARAEPVAAVIKSEPRESRPPSPAFMPKFVSVATRNERDPHGLPPQSGLL